MNAGNQYIKASDRSGEFRTERLKILFQYSVMLIASVIAGGIFTAFLSNATLREIGYGAAVHFTVPFLECENLGEAIRWVLHYSASELICVGISFLFTFSVINYLASDLILVYEGFKSGFSVVLLYHFLTTELGGYQPKMLQFLLFSLVKLLILFGFLKYSCRLTSYSYELKKFTETGRTILNTGVLLSLMATTLAFCGMILFVNGIYCLLIFLL